MFAFMRKRMFTPAGIVSIIALVFAMVGAAWAAGGLTKQQEKQVKKIVTAEVKKHPGPTGPAGPAGPTGPAGANGSAGPAGPAGTSVTNTAVPTSSATCNHLGGAEFKVGAGTATTACNGEPGPLVEKVPSGKTMTGAWGFTENLSPYLISYPFRLSAPIAKENVTYLAEGEGETTDCPGTAEAPKAASGNLCIYTTIGEATYEEASIFPLSNVDGVFLTLHGEFAFGTWAVTAP